MIKNWNHQPMDHAESQELVDEESIEAMVAKVRRRKKLIQ
jgi:hypothetical protein